jgi:hypothetical protein
MFEVKKRENIAKEWAESLKNDLKMKKISLRKFANEFYKEKVDPDAGSVELDGHFERFKTAIKRNAEVTALYLELFNNKYYTDKSITVQSMDAAYELYCQLSTRISSRALPDNIGCDVAALKSVHSLFMFWRELHSKYGRQSCFFIKHSKPFFDQHLRTLTTKWHNKLSEDEINKDFRCDLLVLQKSTNSYIQTLELDFGF